MKTPSDQRDALDSAGPGVAYVNGQFVPAESAMVSVYDHGFLYGDGVFDTLFARHGYVFKLEEHLERLARSARAIQLDLRVSIDEIGEIAVETVERSHLRDAYIKIVASRGVGPVPLLDPRGCVPTLVVFARPYLSLATGDARRTGIRAQIASIRRIPTPAIDPRIKSLNYLTFVLAKQEVVSAGYDEALVMDEYGMVCEAPGYNIFVVAGGAVLTPPTSILEGITRETILELCDDLGLRWFTKPLAPYDLFNATELFLTSTAGGIVPVRSVGSSAFAACPGPVFQRLETAYDEMLRSGRHGTQLAPNDSSGSS